jgi:pimeloyl-ACP methyl ester carboxylesterase
MSDMEGSKALALDDYCQREGRACLRFDYSGHGQSGGKFTDGTIGRWLDDALAMFDEFTEGPQIVVGSSMGGWLALLLAVKRPERVSGLVLVAPAPDFTEKLMWANFSAAEKATLARDGVLYQPSEYGKEPCAITRDLIEEGKLHNLLDGPIGITCPVRLLHGMKDVDVPWQWSLKIVERLASTDVVTTLVKAGDHRLSTPADLVRLCSLVDELC